MVIDLFGIGAGKAEIKIDKTNFSSAELIKGKLTLTLNKSIMAKRVFVKLIAQRKVCKIERTTKGRRRRCEFKEIYCDTKEIDGEKEYSSELNYDFEIMVPENAPKSNYSKISIGPFIVINGSEGSIRWFLTAGLELPMAFDVSKTIQLNVS